MLFFLVFRSHQYAPKVTGEPAAQAESVYAEMTVSADMWAEITGSDSDDWPLTVDSGVLSCEGTPERPYLFFASLDRETIWPLNGRSRDLGMMRNYSQ